jgi:hypothetical protein
MPALTGLYLYPIKSCRGLAVGKAVVGARGLEGDRRYMIVDASGRFVTQRQFPRMALIDVALVPGGWRVCAPDQPALEIPQALERGTDGSSACMVRIWRQTVEATLAGPDVNIWFSNYLGFACGLVYMADEQHRPVENAAAAFDDEVSFADGAPLLLISEASLESLNARLESPVAMRNFRPNLVVSGTSAHAEDAWREIRIGAARFQVAWPCSRCIMTTVDPASGTRRADGEPMQTLRSYRQRDGAVYFGQNLLPRVVGRIAVGDAVEVL